MESNSAIELLHIKQREIQELFARPFNHEYLPCIKAWFRDFIVFLSQLELTGEQLKSPSILLMASAIRGYYDRFYIFDEALTTLEVLEGNQVPEFTSHNSSLAEEEMRIMDLNPNSNLCFVGSGPYPWSAIRYARKYSCKITAVETRPEAVVLSEGLIRHFGLSEQIKVICADAQTLDYTNFSTVVIAAMVYPKHTLLDVIYPELATGAKMLVRSAIGQYIFVYDNLDIPNIPTGMQYSILRGNTNCELETFVFSR